MHDHLADLPVRTFLDHLASSSPTPGGGAAAALVGAAGAALVSMVCRLTIGKRAFAGVEEQVRRILERSEALREQLTEDIDRDALAYEALIAAYRLPKEAAEEAQQRAAAIHAATVHATEVPAEIAERCSEVLELCREAAGITNPRAVSDLEAGAFLAWGALNAALANVWANLPGIPDQAIVAAFRARRERLLERGQQLLHETTAAIRASSGQ